MRIKNLMHILNILLSVMCIILSLSISSNVAHAQETQSEVVERDLSSMSIAEILINLRIGKLSLNEKIKHQEELSKKVIEKASTQMNIGKNPLAALETVFMIPLDAYSEELYQKVEEIIPYILKGREAGEVDLSKKWLTNKTLFGDLTLKDYLVKLCVKNRDLARLVAKLVEARIIDVLNRDVEDLPYEGFATISVIAQNFIPDADKNAAINAASHVRTEKGKNFLYSRINEFVEEGRLTISDRVNLFFSGWYFSRYYVKYFVLFAVSLAFFVFLLRKSTREFIILYFNKFLSAMGIDKEEIYSYLSRDEDEDELTKLHKILGVDEDCSNEELEEQYIKLTKKYEGANTDKAKEEFKEIRLSYKRIMQIRRSSFNFGSSE